MSKEADQGDSRRHVVVVPWTEQGHINPLMQIAQYLQRSFNDSLKVSFVVTENIHNRMSKANNSNNGINMVIIPDNISEEEHAKRTIDVHEAKTLQQNLTPLVTRHLQNLTPAVTTIIYDAVLPWIHDIAKSLGITKILTVSTCSVSTFSIFYHISSLVSAGHVSPIDGSIPASIDALTIQGLPRISKVNVPWNLGRKDDQEVMFNVMKKLGDHSKQVEVVMFNSFYELEYKVIEELTTTAEFEVLPLGPLLLLSNHINEINIPASSIWTQDLDCMKWLKQRDACSVLYISFGSVAILDDEQLHKFALGIEASHHSFLWVLRPNLIDGKFPKLPNGFIERTKDRGVIVSWAPQSLVLSHPSIGAFLTHCGWNSTMEAICNGVPMLTWPYFGDQRMNCHYILNEWKIGMPITKNDGVLDQELLMKAIQCIMVGKKGEEIRKNIMLLKEKSRIAATKGMELLRKKIFDVDHM